MNCCDSYGNCTQGRDCPVRIERALKKSNLFWDVVELLTAFAVSVCMVASLCFMFGYIWNRVML